MLMALVVVAFVVVIVTFVVMTFMIVAFVASRCLNRVRLGGVFEGVSRTQRFTFQALWAPIKLPLGAVAPLQAIYSGLLTAMFSCKSPLWTAVQGRFRAVWPGEYLISW